MTPPGSAGVPPAPVPGAARPACSTLRFSRDGADSPLSRQSCKPWKSPPQRPARRALGRGGGDSRLVCRHQHAGETPALPGRQPPAPCETNSGGPIAPWGRQAVPSLIVARGSLNKEQPWPTFRPGWRAPDQSAKITRPSKKRPAGNDPRGDNPWKEDTSCCNRPR